MKKHVLNIYLYSLSLICVFLLFNCDRINNKDITVFYFNGSVEPIVPFECSQVENWCKGDEYDDTVFIDSALAEQIENAIKKVNSHDVLMRAKTNKDHIFYFPIIYVNVGNLNVCLNECNNLCWIQGDDMEYHPSVISNRIAYILKWRSGYYDYFSPFSLQFDTGIQQYGIPADYKENREEDVFDSKDTSKILLKVR